jgi:hypothetical protein
MRTPGSKTIMATLALMLAGFCLIATAQDQSIAEAARKAREQKKTAPQAKRVFTNDNIPTVPGTLSTIGTNPTPGGDASSGTTSSGGQTGGADSGTTPANPDDKTKSADEEAKWRKKFAELRAKLASAEKEVDIMQRELNLKREQYYSDPNQAMREQYKYPSGSGGEVNDLAKKIADKKKEIESLKQQLSELEDDLRRAGLPSGWSRQP